MNGVIKQKMVVKPTFDKDGVPMEVEDSFGYSIPCKYTSASRNDVVEIGNGIFSQASYAITIKDMNFDASQIQLIDSRGNVICEKDIKSLEVLENIRRVKILV